MDFHWSQKQWNDFKIRSLHENTMRFVQMFPPRVLFAWFHLLSLQNIIMSMFNISFDKHFQSEKKSELESKLT